MMKLLDPVYCLYLIYLTAVPRNGMRGRNKEVSSSKNRPDPYHSPERQFFISPGAVSWLKGVVGRGCHGVLLWSVTSRLQD